MTTQTQLTPTLELARSFESTYAEARLVGDPTRIPWDDESPSPLLVGWLDRDAPAVLRCGSRVAVIGCGRGHDARELMRRGYEVTAFDVSATAIAWARELDPDNAGHYIEANVLEPPGRWVHRFDLVVEINTLQSYPSECRGAIFEATERLVGMRGHLLVICRGTPRPVALEAGPPWALTERELLAMGTLAGLRTDGVEQFVDTESEAEAVPRMRALFRRD